VAELDCTEDGPKGEGSELATARLLLAFSFVFLAGSNSGQLFRNMSRGLSLLKMYTWTNHRLYI
jgi:hypothetical protein